MAADARKAAADVEIANKFLAATVAYQELMIARRELMRNDTPQNRAALEVLQREMDAFQVQVDRQGNILTIQGRTREQMYAENARIAAAEVRDHRQQIADEAQRERDRAKARADRARREAQQRADEARDRARAQRDSALRARQQRLAAQTQDKDTQIAAIRAQQQAELNRMRDGIQDGTTLQSEYNARRAAMAVELREAILDIDRSFNEVAISEQAAFLERSAVQGEQAAQQRRESELRNMEAEVEMGTRTLAELEAFRRRMDVEQAESALARAEQVRDARQTEIDAERAYIEASLARDPARRAAELAQLTAAEQQLDDAVDAATASLTAANEAMTLGTRVAAHDAAEAIRELRRETALITAEVEELRQRPAGLPPMFDVFNVDSWDPKRMMDGLRRKLYEIRAQAAPEIREAQDALAELARERDQNDANIFRLSGSDDPEAQAELARLQARNQMIEAEIARHQERVKELQGQTDAEITEAKFDHWQQVAGVTSQALGNLSQMQQTVYSTWRDQRSAELDQLGYTEEEKNKVLAKEGKKRFFMMKALMIAETIGNTITATMSAFKFGSQIGGPILGGVFAASAAAFGLAQIARLTALTPEGGGSAGAGGGGLGGLSSGGFTALNGTVVADRVRDYETNRRGGALGDEGYGEVATRMEAAADRFAETAANLRVTMEDRTAESAYVRGRDRNDRLNV